MPGAEIDLVDQILGPGAAEVWPAPDFDDAKSAPISDTKDSSAPRPRRRLGLPGRPRFGNPFSRLHVGGRGKRAIGLGLAFTIGAAACVALLAAIAVAAFNAEANRAVPGVHAGSLDVSGLGRDQIVARLNTTYGYLGQGTVTVTTPSGSATATYQQFGRAVDAQAMADEAMGVGHSGSAIGDAATMVRTAIGGRTVAVVVKLDPKAVATAVRAMAAGNNLAINAQAWTKDGAFQSSSSAAGAGIDEAAISSAIVSHLTDANATASFKVGAAFVVLKPAVSDADAQAAIVAAGKMIVDVNLIMASNQAPASGETQAAPKIVSIDSKKVLNWIVFGTTSSGKYGPIADPSRMLSDLTELAPQARTAPVEPSIVFGGEGKPVGLQGGSDGVAMDIAGTAKAIAAYLDTLAAGGQEMFAVTAVTTAVHPNLSADTLSQLVNIGSWTTTFYPDVSNGYGANIRVPASLLNGKVVSPGQQFSFLDAVSPIDEAHGYAMGGVIEHGVSNHTGAMGGGICSASTTMFNAAANAGLQIDERHAHYYYISRYPVGLDATVYENGEQVWDLKWTNDTPNPIVIVAGSTYGSSSSITVQLWSLPTGRKTSFTPEFKANVDTAVDHTEYTTSLSPGQTSRSEYPTDGFDTSRTRTVTDASGKVIHTDTWGSHYARVDGLLLVGTSAPPPSTPTPAPTAAVMPEPAAGQAARRRWSRGARGR
jgi:vancomycin resistance protein YoaR